MEWIENLKVHAILAGADAEDQDILPSTNSLTETDDDEEILLERAFRCPETCPPPSDLNS